MKTIIWRKALAPADLLSVRKDILLFLDATAPHDGRVKLALEKYAEAFRDLEHGVPFSDDDFKNRVEQLTHFVQIYLCDDELDEALGYQFRWSRKNLIGHLTNLTWTKTNADDQEAEAELKRLCDASVMEFCYTFAPPEYWTPQGLQNLRHLKTLESLAADKLRLLSSES